MKKPKYNVIVNYVWCKKCGICTEFCPKGVFVEDKDNKPIVKLPEECINCKLCEIRCPDFAIKIKQVDSTTYKKK